MEKIILDDAELALFESLIEFVRKYSRKPKEAKSRTILYNEAARMLGRSNGNYIYQKIFKEKRFYDDDQKIFDKTFSEFLNELQAGSQDKLEKLQITDKEAETIFTDIRIHEKKFVEWKSAYEKKRNKIVLPGNLPGSKRPTGPSNQITSSVKPIFSHFNHLKNFQETIWYCYERIEDNQLDRLILEFSSFDDNKGLCSVILIPSEKTMNYWMGECQFNGYENLLTITLTNSERDREYTHILIKVDRRAKEQNLCVGHKSFLNPENNNVVTKTIILTKCDENLTLVAGQFSLSDEKIEQDIRDFFKDRKLNRLSSPHKIPVYDIDTLGKWLKQNKEPNQSPYPVIIGHYTVYYKIKPNNPTYEKDILKIYSSSDSQLQAKYTRVIEGESHIWIGHATPNFAAKTLSIDLDGPFSDESEKKRKLTQKPMFMLVEIPVEETQHINTLTAIILGCRDDDKGSVARLLVMIKQEVIDTLPIGKIEADITLFFNEFGDRSWIRPPTNTRVAKFSDLKKAKKGK